MTCILLEASFGLTKSALKQTTVSKYRDLVLNSNHLGKSDVEDTSLYRGSLLRNVGTAASAQIKSDRRAL